MLNAGPIPLFPCHSIEDFPTHYAGSEAEGVLSAWTVSWHPAIIAESGCLPKWSSTDYCNDDLEGRLLLIPAVATQRVCAEIRRLISDKKCQAIDNLESRDDYLNHPAFGRWNALELETEVIQEFFALAYGYLQVQIMTRQIRYSSGLDESEFEARLLQAATAAVEKRDDLNLLLQSCYDLLLEERNRFYPTQPELLDIVMVANTTLGRRFELQLEAAHKMNLLFTGQLVNQMQSEKPEIHRRVRAAVESKRAEIIGGLHAELPAKLMGVESQLNQLAQGIQEIRQYLGQRPALFARRTFGLNPTLPGLLKQFDFSGALHANLGHGQIPDASTAMINWESTDGSTLYAIHQKPRDAANPGAFLGLGKFIGEALDSAHHATVVFVHWPDRFCESFQDLLRTCQYGPLLGAFNTASDYFDGFFDPGYAERFTDDEYRSRTLADWTTQAVSNPVSRIVNYWKNHTEIGCLYGATTMSAFVGNGHNGPECQSMLDQLGSLMDLNDACLDLKGAKTAVLSDSCAAVSQRVRSELGQQLGVRFNAAANDVVVIANPLSFPRRLHLRLEGVQTGPRKSDGPIVIADSSDFGSELVVDLPAMGSVMVSPSKGGPDPLRKDPPMIDGWCLRNEFFEVKVDEKTGGILSLNRHQKRGNLLTQRLSYRTAERMVPNSEPYAVMLADSIETFQDTRVHAQVVSRGTLRFEDQVVGRYRQTIRVARGCSELHLAFHIEPLVELSGKPWENYFCSRWAWHDESAEIRRESLGSRFYLMEEKFEAPNLIQIESEQARLSLLTGGLPFHRRSGRRILDTLLLTQGETCRDYEMGIALNAELPTHKAASFQSPALIGFGDPESAKTGWLFHCGAKNLMATMSQARVSSAGSIVGAMFRFQETEGRSGQLKLTCPRDVASAHRVNFLGEFLGDGKVDGRKVSFDFGPNEHFQIELNWRS
ncbi:MAG: hypothetical protein MK106_08080 [Mariniblastus sp.]|nr:hypothetical protein [Mariniblastus sp.]